MGKPKTSIAKGKFKIKATHDEVGGGYDVVHIFQLDGDTETVATGLAATLAGFMKDRILEEKYDRFLEVFKQDVLEYINKTEIEN